MKLEFRKPRIRLGECFDTGYYFKGEFLSRYKNLSLKILRDRVKDLSDEKRNKTDEWKVIHQEYLKTCEVVERTNQKKQLYYLRLTKQGLRRKNLILLDKIRDLEERKKEKVMEFNDRIKDIHKEIQVNEEQLK